MTLKAIDLELGYNGQVIVPPFSYEFPMGKITCLIGPNGCGKSTILRGISRLLSPQAGQVTLDGRTLPTWPEKTLAQRMAILPQSPSAPEGISLYQLVSHGRFPYQSLLSPLQRADYEAINWALEVTELTHLRHRLFHTLSGGERQRGWIALTLAQKSEILLLDEPNTYLDLGHQLEIMELLQELNQTFGITIIMVLHDINQAIRYSDHLLAISQGKIVASGSPELVITEKLIDQVFQVSIKKLELTEELGKSPYCLPLGSNKNRLKKRIPN